MITFYDPVTHQVMAFYSTDTTSTVWVDGGYIRTEIPSRLSNELSQLGRECRIDLNPQGIVLSITPFPNPVQPRLSDDVINRQIARESVRVKLLGLGLTTEEILTLIPQ